MWWICAVETDLPWPAEPINVAYNGCTFNFSPPSETEFASIAVEAPIEAASEVARATRRLLSILAWVDGSAVTIEWSVGNPGWRQPMRRSKPLERFHFQPRTNFDFLPVPRDEKAALAIALYRTAVSSNSLESEFLQFFRVLEVAHGKKMQNPTFVNSLLDRAANVEALSLARARLIERGLNPGKHLVVYGRHAVAHGYDNNVVDPDIPEDYQALSDLMPIIRSLAVFTIETDFGVPTLQSYYRHHEYEVEGFRGSLPVATQGLILASTDPAVAFESPITTVSVGLRDKRFEALSGLEVVEARASEGGANLVLRSQDGLVRSLVRFDLANRRLLFDVERGVWLGDDGSARSLENAADVCEIILGLVHNGELHVWNDASGEVLGRQSPNIPVNMDLRKTNELLTLEIGRLREAAAKRVGGTHRENGDIPATEV